MILNCRNFKNLIYVILLITIISCGGGTTGTSSVGIKQVKGGFNQENKELSNHSMEVFDNSNFLFNSQTDNNSEFEMQVPVEVNELGIKLLNFNQVSFNVTDLDYAYILLDFIDNKITKNTIIKSDIQNIKGCNITDNFCELELHLSKNDNNIESIPVSLFCKTNTNINITQNIDENGIVSFRYDNQSCSDLIFKFSISNKDISFNLY